MDNNHYVLDELLFSLNAIIVKVTLEGNNFK